jgi:hypothetical protein
MDLNEIKKYFENENNFISFRDSENVSLINKNNTYGTPTGIYTYPCKMFKDKVNACETIDDLKSVFPFLGRYSPKYLYFYTINHKFPHLTSDSTFDDILPYYKKILNLKVANYQEGILTNLKKYINGEKEEKDDFYKLKSFSLFRTFDIRDEKEENEVQKFWTLTYHLHNDDTAKWSNILRGIGIGYLIDYGIGYIHSNEPIQSVIINNKCIEGVKIFDLVDYSYIKNKIKNNIKNGELFDVVSDLFEIYSIDQGFFWTYLDILIDKDINFIFSFKNIICKNTSERKPLNIINKIIEKMDSKFCTRLTKEEELLKVFVDKFGDGFIKKYIIEFSKNKPGSCGGIVFDDDNEKCESNQRKIIVASLLNVNRKKTIEFFTSNKDFNYDDELDFFEKNEDQIKKYRNNNSLAGLDYDLFGRFFREDKEDKVIERRYELFKQSYEKATQTSWTYEKFKERSKYWEFYGDHNGYISLRLQRSGLYKFTSVAGSLTSISKGLEDIQKKGLPVWGAVSPKIAEVMVKRYGYSKPNLFLLKILYKIFKKSSGTDVETELNNDGTITVNYDDVGTVTKVIITNKGALPIIKTLIKDKIKI